jgi:3'-phosphoadenosine 5'-phosphosulfate sulfotransferase (PAPS reductase)/FAD synthetase
VSERYIVSVSGGKDSTALYLWAIERFGPTGFEAVFADTGHEHPVTLNYVRHLHEMAKGPKVHWVKSDFTDRLKKKNKEPTDSVFLDMCLWKGRVPSSKAQFCTEHLKLIPIRDWLHSTMDDREPVMLTGIRAGESERRSKMPERQWLKLYDCDTWRPLLKWSEEEVFAMLEKFGVPPNPLYAEGFSRVGCFPCIHARKSELARLPDWAWDKLQEWETRIGRSWFPAGTVPGKFIPTIQDAREWAKTSRGGKQFDMFSPDAKDVPSCMSTWGACE